MGLEHVDDFSFLKIGHLTKGGEWKQISPALCEYLGYSKEELRSANFSDVSHPEDISERANFLADIEEDGAEFEHRFIHKNGDLRWAKIEASRIPSESQDRDVIAIYVTDIAQYKSSQEQLQQQVELTQKFLNAIDEGYLLINQEGQIIDVNSAYCKILGYSREELLTHNIAEFRPDISEKEEENLIKHIIKEGNLSFETRHKASDGEVKVLEARTTSFDLNGSTLITGFVREVTSQKQAQKKLIESEERWHRLVEYNPLPILLSVEGTIEFVNKAGLQLYGVETEGELLDKSVFDFVDAQSSEKIKGRIKKMEQGEILSPSEQRIIKENGDELLVEVHSIPVKYRGQEAVQTVLRDITEAKKRENEITKALEEKEVLLQEIHHRVKNNLAVISGLLELQAMTHQDETVQTIIRESQLRIQSMAMIHEKLYKSPSLSDVEFNTYVRELVETIVESYHLQQKDISINFNLTEVTLDITKAIPAALILNELVSNCYKHAFTDVDTGRVDVTISKSNEEISMSVADDGQGLPDDFSIQDQETLGMKLISTLSDQLNGDLSHKSENGAIFNTTFPA